MAITLTFDQVDAGIPAGSVDRGRTDIKSTGAVAATRAHTVTITVGNIPTGALVDVVLLDEPPNSNPLLTQLAPETWTLEFDIGCWGPFRVRVTATASGQVVSSVTRRISIRSPGYHIDYPGLAERYDPNATLVPTVPSVELTEMNEGSTNRPLVDFHRQMVEAIEGGVGGGGGGVIPDGSITEEKLAPSLSDNLLRADGTIPFTGDQNAAGHIIHNVGVPLLPGDAVPLSSVIAAVNRAGTRTPCRLVATIPITASNTQVVDSVATVNGDRVLLTAQASPVDNGIYIANDAGAWLRSSDADSSEELLPGMVIFITAGTAFADSGWILSTDAPILLGTSALTFTRFTGSAQLIAGAGLTKTVNSLDVVAHADGSIVVSADAVQVGTLATDAQHGTRGGGPQHAAATPSVAGFQSALDKTKLDGIASGAAALSSSAPANVGTAAAVGVGTTAARSDHVHAHGAQTDGTLHAAATTSVAGFQSALDKTKLDGIASGAAALSSSTPAAVAFTGSVGVGTTAARSDHVHAHGAQTDGTLHAAATPSVAGFQSALDKTKLDAIASGAAALTTNAPTQITVTTAAVGVETAAAKGDHVHSVSTAAPSALAVGGAQSTGSATSLARSDHAHAMPGLVTTAADGFASAADKLKLDGLATGAAALTGTAPVAVDNAAAAVGVGTTAARHDHKHTVSVGTPVALTIGGANAQGSATTVARSDHTHAMPGLVTTAADGFASAVDKLKLDGVETGAQVTSFARVQTALAAASSNVGFNAQRLTSVADPTAAQDAATKAYVDAVALGLDTKASVRLVATTNVAALTGAVAIDGVTTSAGDRVLLTAQTAGSANGIYTTAAGAWARSTDADSSAEVNSGMYVFVTEGTANSDSGWALTTNDPIVLGTTPLAFTQVSGAGQIIAGAGLTKTGNQLDVVAHADGSIVVAADSVQLGVIATDAQHGARGGGTLHAAAIAGGASGFLTGVDKIKLDSLASGATNTPLATVTSPAVGNAAAAVGGGTTAARQDHTHLVSSGTPVALTLAGSNAAGSAATLALSDHVHAIPATATPVALTVGAANAPGAAVTLVRSDHVHAMPGLATGAADGFQSAADKTRLDGLSASFKTAVRVASVTNIPNIQVPGMQPNVVDGIALAVGDRILFKDASASIEWRNGIYHVTVVGTGSDGTWLRATESDSAGELVTGSVVYVAEGTHAGQRWQLTTTGPITVGTTPQIWAQQNAALATDAQHGTRGGGTLHAVATASTAGFQSAADKARLDALRARSYFDARLATATTLPAYTATTISTNRPRLTATANGALSVDGVAVVAGDLVVVLFEAAANCGVYEVIAPGTAGTPYQLDLAYSGAYTATVSGSQMIVRTGSAGYAYCNREFRPGSTTSGLFIEIPGELQLWPRDTTPPTTVYPGWLYELDMLGSTVSLTLVSPPGSEQVLRGVRFGVNAGATISLTITPSSPSKIDSPYATSGASGGSPGTSISYSVISGSATTWVCGRSYTSYNPDSPYWKVDTAYGLAAESVLSASGRIDFTGTGPVAGSVLTGKSTSQAWWVPPDVDPSTNGFRLSPTADDSPVADGAFSIIYLAPVKSDRIALYDTTVSGWRLCSVNGFGQTLSGRTTGTPFDVFISLSAPAPTDGTAAGVAVEFVNWTLPTARATAITRVNGVLTKSGAPASRYLGTCSPRSATTYHMQTVGNDTTPAKCDLWNIDNQVTAAFRYARSWTPETFTHPTANTWVGANGSSSRFEFVQGVPGTWTRAQAYAAVQTKTFAAVTGIGFDTVGTPSGTRTRVLSTSVNDAVTANGQYSLQSPIGVHYLAWIIWASNVAVVWWGAQSTHESGLEIAFQC